MHEFYMSRSTKSFNFHCNKSSLELIRKFLYRIHNNPFSAYTRGSNKPACWGDQLSVTIKAAFQWLFLRVNVKSTTCIYNPLL